MLKGRSAPGSPLLTVAVLMLGALVSAWLAARTPLGVDYPRLDAGPPIRALLEGDIAGFLARQPLMGGFSLILRAPFAALSGLGDGSELLVYRLGAFPCLMAAALLAVVVVRRMEPGPRPLLPWLVVGGLLLVNPMTIEALWWGHPEEVLGGSLCILAVLVAGAERPVWAGLLLGLALSTKQWAVLAVLPVLLSARAGRPLLGLTALLTAAVLTLPLAVGNPQNFIERNGSTLNVGYDMTPVNLWWPLAESSTQRVFDGVAEVDVTTYTLPAVLHPVTHPLIVLVGILLALPLWRRRPSPGVPEGLCLLALALLLRCVLDPVNVGYYHVPFLLAFTAWETLTRRGPPILSLGTAAALWLTFGPVLDLQLAPLTFVVYMSWTLPLAAYLSFSLYAPATLERLTGSPVPGNERRWSLMGVGRRRLRGS